MNAFTNIGRLPTRAILATFTVCALLLSAPIAAQTTTGTISTGSSLFTSKGCIGCHAASSSTKANASNAGAHITYANTQGMGGTAGTAQEYADIAAYLASLFTDLTAQTVTFATAKAIVIPNVFLSSTYGDYVGLRQVSAPARGTTSFTLGSTTMTYTPNSGQCGSDTFTYQAYRTLDSGTSNTRTVSLTIDPPAAPNITSSAATASGTVGSAFTYNPTSSGGSVNSYTITGGSLPAGLSLNASTGAISGTPTTAGSSAFTLNAFNCSGGSLTGQTSTRSITITIITVPGAPTIGTATAGNAQISVAFTAPVSNGGSAITSYTATCGGITGNNTISPVLVTGLTNGTAYTCTVKANNAAGSSAASSASNSATPITVPSAPIIGTATAGNAQISVAFTASVSNGGSTITSYTATCGGITGNNTVSPVVVTGLTNGTAYTCTVKANNAAGSSAASSASNSATPITVAGAPTIGTATAGNAQISVAFTAPVSNGGSTIINYTATCGAISASNTVSPVVVTGLTNGTAYTCTVKANNAAGSSAASSTSNSATPITVPSAPTIGTATAGNAQISVAFTASVSNGGSTIINYTATCGGISASNTVSPVLVTGLTNGTAYTCTVRATNGAGNSAESGFSNSATPLTVPGAPTMGTATAGNAQISVAFNAPVSNGGSTIINYTATCGAISASNTVSPVVVTGLTNGTAYTCTVVATNSQGPGAASTASSSVAPATVPAAPIMGSAVTGDTRATIIFTAPANGGSAITSYTATCTPGGTGTNTASPIAVTGLTNTTTYTCSVYATNAIGNSAASGTVTVTPVKGSVLVPIIDFLFD